MILSETTKSIIRRLWGYYDPMTEDSSVDYSTQQYAYGILSALEEVYGDDLIDEIMNEVNKIYVGSRVQVIDPESGKYLKIGVVTCPDSEGNCSVLLDSAPTEEYFENRQFRLLRYETKSSVFVLEPEGGMKIYQVLDIVPEEKPYRVQELRSGKIKNVSPEEIIEYALDEVDSDGWKEWNKPKETETPKYLVRITLEDCKDKTSSPAEYFMKFSNLEDAQKAAYEARKGLDKFSDKSSSPQRRKE